MELFNAQKYNKNETHNLLESLFNFPNSLGIIQRVPN